MRARVLLSSAILSGGLLACRSPEPSGNADATTSDTSDTSDTADGSSSSSDTANTSDSTDTTDAGETTDTTETGEPETWRSALYPEDWTPGFADPEGHFLHDFSWAGYHNGAQPLPDLIPGVELSVLDFGADPSGATDANAAIQATIDAVSQAGGGVVLLPPGSYRCDDRLQVSSSGVVIRGAGPGETQLWFTRTQGMTGLDHLSVQSNVASGAELPLTIDGEALSADVWVADAGALAVGDAVAVGWVITDMFVDEHQMSGIWVSFNGTWRPFFRREVQAINCGDEGCRVTLDVPLRYPALLRDQASLRVESGYLSEVGIEALSVSSVGDWAQAWATDRSHVIAMSGVADAWIRDVHSFESPNSSDDRGRHLMSNGVLVRDSKRVTIVDSIMAKPQHRGGGGNGYLFEISRSNEVLTRDCQAYDGRHNFIQNWDFGTSGCVWLRIHTEGSMSFTNIDDLTGSEARSEYHHSLAMANLVDDSVLEDGWSAVNRNGFSSGAGHTATQDVFWNVRGAGTIRCFQFGWGYVIGTIGLTVRRLYEEGQLLDSFYTEPEDWLEGEDEGDTLEPSSLYEDQLTRRLGG